MEPILRFTGKDLQDITFDEWLASKPKELGEMATKWFNIMKTIGPEVQPIFHDNYPIVCIDEAPFAYVNVFSQHLNVGFFYGNELFDETEILQGTGKKMRHVKIRPGENVDEKAIFQLIEDAYHDMINRISRT